tara:strand:- start:842 stop:1048 length:207 start_codon:yes stop_codon:yes gene_type:complete
MGRAIDMENAMDKLKAQVSRMDSALAKVIEVVDSMQEKAQTTTHVDLVEDVKPKAKKSNETAKRPKKD